MQIKTADGEKNVASKALGGTALGLAIPGTLAFLNQMGGLGNIFNGFGNGYNAVNAVRDADTRYISRLESCISKLEGERYTDSVGIDLYKEIIATSKADDAKINANYIELSKYLAALDKQIAVDKQATIDNLRKQGNKAHVTANMNSPYILRNGLVSLPYARIIIRKIKK